MEFVRDDRVLSGTLANLKQLFESVPLTDVKVPGFLVDGAVGKVFHHRLLDVYLHFENGTVVRCSSIEQYDKLRFAVVDRVTFDFEIGEDHEYAVTSIAELCLKAPSEPRYIESMYLVTAPGISLENGVVKCAGLGIQKDDFLFLDPVNLYGIKIGKRLDYDAWLKEFAGRGDVLEELLWRHGERHLHRARTFGGGR